MRRYRHVYSLPPQKIIRKPYGLFVGVMLALFAITLSPRGQAPEGLKFTPGRIYRITVPSNVQWTDTGYDVEGDQILSFSASGGISLQVGNPMAYCGPDGYDLKTVQQPIQNQNIGALIGKIVLLISIEVDEETGEETRNEMVEIFHIGSSKIVSIPISGRLFLGVNENVAGDNSGQYTVDIRMMEL
jgi:hypothetical protein